MTLLLLHAFPLDSRMWEAQSEALAGRDLVAPDLADLGSTMAEWASAALDRVDGPVVAVGASMGGYCALEVARQAPDRIRGLALIGSRADADSPERLQARAATIERIRADGVEALWEDTGPKLFSPNADPAVVERARSIALEQSPDDLVRSVEAIRDRADASDLVRGLDVPVLVAVGDSDPYFAVEEAEALAADLRRGRLHVFERCGHLASLERREDFNRVLLDFLADVGAADE